MKKLLLGLLLLSSFTIQAQTQNLATLAAGDYMGMNALFTEDEELYGYLATYDYGKSSDSTKKFEYVILDKNLNPFANNTFDGDITAGDYMGYIGPDSTVLLRPSSGDLTYVNKKDAYAPSPMVIDLRTNTIKEKVEYEYKDGKLVKTDKYQSWNEYNKEHKSEKKENGFNYYADVIEIKEGGYMVYDHDDYGVYTKNSHIIRFDKDRQLMWSYSYNEEGSKDGQEAIYYLCKDEQSYYALFREYTKESNTYVYGTQQKEYKSHNKFYLLVLDMKTGKEVHKKHIPDPEELLPAIKSFETYSYGSLDNERAFDDKMVLVGKVYGAVFTTGYCRLVIDKKTYEVDFKTISYKDDFSKYLSKINKNGYVEKGYLLDPRDIFIMKDGSVSILFEKYKPATTYTVQKTTDMVYVYTNKNFEVIGALEIEKEKSRNSNTDYLFSQNINDGNDVVFFFYDIEKNEETRKKEINLYINTLISGKFKQDVFPIFSKDEYVLIPYIAKEGYVLLHEYNKKAKYNQVRLERLNY